MQLFGLHGCIYKLNKLVLPEEKIDPVVLIIKRKVGHWDKLKKSKGVDRDIAEIVGISRASYYRYKKNN